VAAVGETDFDAGCTGDHVRVGEDIAILRQHEAGAMPAAMLNADHAGRDFGDELFKLRRERVQDGHV
jgi:hypothetical protein